MSSSRPAQGAPQDAVGEIRSRRMRLADRDQRRCQFLHRLGACLRPPCGRIDEVKRIRKPHLASASRSPPWDSAPQPEKSPVVEIALRQIEPGTVRSVDRPCRVRQIGRAGSIEVKRIRGLHLAGASVQNPDDRAPQGAKPMPVNGSSENVPGWQIPVDVLYPFSWFVSCAIACVIESRRLASRQPESRHLHLNRPSPEVLDRSAK